jgi:thiol-disulfide isomerase/thioredoxin
MKRLLVQHRLRNVGVLLREIGVLLRGVPLIVCVIGAYWVTQSEVGWAAAKEPTAAAQRGFVFRPYAIPRPVPNIAFENGQGRKLTLAHFRGRMVLLNIWATWCPPCRKEMPTLDRLQKRLGGPGFEVVALSIDQGGALAVKSFFDEIGVQALAIYVDKTAQVGGDLGIVGLPSTLLIDGAGREIGRVIGPAEWDGPEVISLIRSYLAPGRKP